MRFSGACVTALASVSLGSPSRTVSCVIGAEVNVTAPVARPRKPSGSPTNDGAPATPSPSPSVPSADARIVSMPDAGGGHEREV